MYFNTFTNYFFYFFVIYNYFSFKFPEQTQDVIIFMSYNFIYLYSKLQIILHKNKNYNELCKKIKSTYDNINNNFVSKFYKTTNMDKKITLDFVFNNEIKITLEKQEFLDNFYLNKTSKCSDIFDYDFVIVNCENNMKKVIIKNTTEKDIDIENIFDIEPLKYTPLLCEFIMNDKVIKINLCDDKKSYNYLVLNNCLNSYFFNYFMKKYYDIDVRQDYLVKIIDDSINPCYFNSSEIMKFEKTNIIKY